VSALGRCFLRLAAAAALRDATIVGGNVFDSRIEAVNLSEEQPIAGAIAVYAEQDSGDALWRQNGGPPFRPEVELVLEITMQARVVQDDGSYVVGTPATDDELEATLDVIETQSEIALFRSYAANSALFRRIAKRVVQKTSIRFVDPQAGDKLAVRYVTYKIEIDDPEIPIFDAVLTGLARLPEPFRSVAEGWPSGPEKEKATAFSALLTAAPPPAFEQVQATVPPPPSTQAPGTDPDPPRVETWILPQ
jgi:hypothetical protein